MGDNEAKAKALLEEAHKKMNSSKGFFASLFGGGSGVDEALEMYGKAANLFKMAKSWGEAGNTFNKIAQHHVKSGSKHEAATAFVDAANCYRKTDPKEATVMLQKAIDIYTEMGRFTIAAKHHQTIGEICETELADRDKSIQHYEQAADYFRGEESNSSANKCMVKVAQMSAQNDNFEKAVQIYEQVAASCLESKLLQYSAGEYFFKAALCHLCIDHLNANHAIQRYEDQYPAFSDKRECKLIKSLVSAVEDQDVEGFTASVAEYDSISKFDSWHTSLLLKVKKSIPIEEDIC